VSLALPHLISLFGDSQARQQQQQQQRDFEHGAASHSMQDEEELSSEEVLTSIQFSHVEIPE
jgi:hypothetical protein